MPAVTGSLFNIHSSRIEEVINKSVDIILPGLDPIYQNVFLSAEGVGPSDAIGRDMEIIRLFQGGLTGVIEQAKPHGDFPLYGDDTDTDFGPRIFEQNLAQTFPDPLLGPNQRHYRLKTPMRAVVANIMFTLGELTAEAIPAFIGQIIAPKLEGFARNISHTRCVYFYLNQTDYFQLAAIDAGVTVTGAGPWYIDFTPSNQAVDRFYTGARVDIWDSTGATRQNLDGTDRLQVYVQHCDELTGTVRLTTNVDPDDWDGGTPVTGDIVTYANQRDGTAPEHTAQAGLRSWLKSSGALLGAEADATDKIDVDVYPEHKTMEWSAGGAALTEHTLRQVLRRFHAAKNKYGHYVDTVVASDGVWLAYEATRIGRERTDRTGRTSSLTAQGSSNGTGFGGFSFEMDGRTYMGHTSTYVESGVCYGVRTGGGNWKRYTIPDIKGTAPFAKVEAGLPFRFVAGALTGTSSNQLPIYLASSAAAGATNLVSEGSQMPGWIREQMMPEQFDGFILTNLGENRIYADT